jgi:hypothetical protein
MPELLFLLAIELLLRTKIKPVLGVDFCVKKSDGGGGSFSWACESPPLFGRGWNQITKVELKLLVIIRTGRRSYHKALERGFRNISPAPSVVLLNGRLAMEGISNSSS